MSDLLRIGQPFADVDSPGLEGVVTGIEMRDGTLARAVAAEDRAKVARFTVQNGEGRLTSLAFNGYPRSPARPRPASATLH